MLIADFFGYAAAVCTTIAYIPQAVKVYRSRHTKDISIGMFLIITFGILFWIFYGFMINSIPIIIANVITIVLSGYILIMKIKLDYINVRKKFSKV